MVEVAESGPVKMARIQEIKKTLEGPKSVGKILPYLPQ
jgi:hypothetical protein